MKLKEQKKLSLDVIKELDKIFKSCYFYFKYENAKELYIN